MTVRCGLVGFLVLLLAAPLFGQEITVKGKVVNAFGGKAISALVVYKSYPTGGISGRFNDSTFSFSIFGSSKYQVTASANGFIPRTVIVDPKQAANGVIQHDIALTTTGETVRLNHLIFEKGKSVIDPQSFDELDEVVAMLKANERIEIQLEGHTDNLGNADANMKLSQQRVEAVKKYFVSKGIDKERIKTKAFGGTRPIATEKTEQARALNRRVEMRVLKE